MISSDNNRDFVCFYLPLVAMSGTRDTLTDL